MNFWQKSSSPLSHSRLSPNNNMSHSLLSVSPFEVKPLHLGRWWRHSDVLRHTDPASKPLISEQMFRVHQGLCVFINVPQWSCGLQHAAHAGDISLCLQHCSRLTAARCTEPMSRSVTNDTDIYSSPKCILIIALCLWLVSHHASWPLIGWQGPLTILNQLSTSHRQVWKYSLSVLSDWEEA